MINGHPNDSNYFAWQALHRSFRGRATVACRLICSGVIAPHAQ